MGGVVGARVVLAERWALKKAERWRFKGFGDGSWSEGGGVTQKKTIA